VSQYLYHNKGIYTCNGRHFHNKIDAIFEANLSGRHVEWDYHDAVFSKSTWDHNPPVELEALYLERALQLRSAYDHLVLFYSGGVDSWYILNTFIKNNIHLDEIYMYGPFEAEEKMYNQLGYDRSPGYYTREIKQSLPLLKKLVGERNIKINVFDWTRHIIEAADDRDWFYTAGVRFDPTCMVRSKFHKIFREHSELRHKGKKVGFVYGIDKPRLIRDDYNIYFAFLDVIFTTSVLPTNDINGEFYENDEFFYWTPNMPELSIKMSHVVVDYLKVSNQLHLIKHIDNIAAFHDEAYYKQVNRAIFPDWNHNIWQVKKPTGAIYNEQSKWFLDSDLPAKLKWESSIYELERLCGKKWFNGDSVRNGLRGHLSPKYKISTYRPAQSVDH
jgi:hypothetical protein